MRLGAAIISILLVSGPLVLLAQCPASSAIPIYVAGDILSTDSWSMGTSPVHIIGNVTVREGAVLNIKEGTEVLFDEGTHLNVEGGTLVVQGIPAAPVRFLPNSSSPWKGFYEWIYVNTTPVYQASVSIRWAEFSFGVKGLYLDGVTGARFEDVRFNNAGEAGIYMSRCSDVGVRNCTFTASDGWGVRAEFSDNLTITGCVFSGCTASSVSLADCEYSSFTYSTVRAGSSEKGAELVNSAHLLVDGISLEDGITGLEMVGAAWNNVFGCAFLRDGVGLLLNASAQNLFRGNNFTDCAVPLSFVGGLELARNTFELTNSIGGLPVRAINSGNLDGVAAGAVVLLDCPGSVVSNITFPPGGGAVIVLFGGANTLRDLALPGSAGGIVVLGSNGILLDNVTVTGPAKSGVTLWSTQGVGIRDCRIRGCEAGISFLGPLNITLDRTTLKNSVFDLALSEGAIVRALDCTFGNVSVDATSRLDEDYSLTVSVRDQNGSGLAGVDLQVVHGGKPKYSTPHFGGANLLSGSSGDFPPLELTAVTHAAFSRTEIGTDIEVWDGVNSFEWNPRTLRLSAPTAAVFTATDMGFLAGMVRDPAGDPVGNVGLRLDTGQNATTGADGLYRFPPLAAGTYGLNASLLGWAQQFWPGVIVTAGEVAYVNLTFDAAPGSTGELRGGVLDGLGAPLAGAGVAIDGGSVGVSDSGGLFSIPGAPGGWVNFTVSKAGYLEGRGAAFVPPNGASRRTNVTLLAAGPGETGGVSVRVEDEYSAPLAGARVWLDGAVETFQLSPENGTCLFRAVAAGVHRVSASLAGYRGAGGNVTVLSGSVANLTLVLVLEPEGNGTIAGNVRTAAGAPISGATVLIEELNLSATTDAAGNYSLAPVAAGIHNATASAEGFGPQTVQGLVVAGGAVTVQDFVLRNVRAFFNRTLGVSVTGDFAGAGRLDIRRAPAPTVLPPGGFDRIFEVRASGFTCMTGLRIVVTGQLFKDSLAGRDLSKLDVRLYTHAGGIWASGDRWEPINDSGYDEKGGFFWANVSHFSVFGIGLSAKTTGPTGTTIVAIPPWLSPVAVVAIVLLVGVPIGIIVIRVRQPPSGGGRQGPPVPPPLQRGANL